MEPRAGADEHAAHKPIGTVVAVRRASVRVVPVVAIRANRSRPHRNADWPHSHAHRNLRLRIRERHNRHHRQQRHVSHVPHAHLPLPDRYPLSSAAPEALSKLSTHLNNRTPEKLRGWGWLISTIMVGFNHLRAGLIASIAGKASNCDDYPRAGKSTPAPSLDRCWGSPLPEAHCHL